MRFFTVPLLIAALGTTGTLHSTNLTFRQMAASCSDDSLAGVTFALGHVRVANQPGVQYTVGDIDANGQQKIMLMDPVSGKTATAIAFPHTNTVQAKNLRVERKRAVACILPD